MSKLLARSVLLSAAVLLGQIAHSQPTLDRPLDEPVPYHADSGWVENRATLPAIAYTETVFVDGAGWLRLYFGQVELGAGSFLRVTSELDGESQELDEDALEMWSHTSAYFNGDSVVLELVAGPATSINRVVVERVSWEAGVAVPTGICGICGVDDRVPSHVDWTARLLPDGCSASIYNTLSCAVSAGHCVGGSMVLEFRVPPSNPDCTLNHPPVADQFPVTDAEFHVGGIGNDWAAMAVGTNGEEQKPYARYGEFRPLAQGSPEVGEPVSVWGYGTDSQCTRNQVQQKADGEVFSAQDLAFRYTVDVAPGNSGSAVMRAGEEILGIVTHCPCPNHATRVDHPVFTAGRAEVCQNEGIEAQLTSATVITGTHVSGTLFSLGVPGGNHWVVDSVTQGTRNNTLTEIGAKLPLSTVSGLGLTVQYGIANAFPVFQSLQFFNYETEEFVSVSFSIVSPTGPTYLFYPEIPSPNDYVSDQGEIRLRVAQTAREPQTPDGFTKKIAYVSILGFPIVE